MKNSKNGSKTSSKQQASSSTFNRTQLRAKLKASNTAIDALLVLLGEDPTLEEFSEELVERLVREKSDQEYQAKQAVAEGLEGLTELLQPTLGAHIADQFKQAHKLIVRKALKEFMAIQPELLSEELAQFELEGGWSYLEEQRKNRAMPPQTVDVTETTTTVPSNGTEQLPKDNTVNGDAWG